MTTGLYLFGVIVYRLQMLFQQMLSHLAKQSTLSLETLSFAKWLLTVLILLGLIEWSNGLETYPKLPLDFPKN